MKWALFFCILSFNPTDGVPFQRPEIIKTFVTQQECLREQDRKAALTWAIKKKIPPKNFPGVYIICVEYTGPWKKEVKDG